MILFNSWGLLGLLALPAILAIHLFLRRFRPRVVTGLFLYGPTVRTLAAGRTRQRLRWRASLAGELLAALAITWYLCDPHLAGDQQARHLVVVLDSRWRVGASTPSGSVDAALRAQVAERLVTLGREDRVTLITSGATPTVACGPAASLSEALRVLERWRPTQPWHDLDDALTLGRSLAEVGATMLLASDRVPAVLPPRVGVLASGQPLATSGVVDARWHADAEGRRIVVRVLAQGAAVVRSVELRRGQQVFARQELRLADGVATTAVFPLPDEVRADVVVALSGNDPLPLDDQVTLIAPPAATVLLRLSGGEATDVVMKRVLKAIPDVRLMEDPTTAVQVQVGGEMLPHAGTWRLRFAAGNAPPVLGPFLTRRGHPTCGGLDFTGVLWAGGVPAAELPGGATALVEAGGTVLISEERRGRDRDLTLHSDLRSGSLTHHPAWPAFVANLIAARRAALPGVRQPNVVAGQEQLVVLPPGRSEMMLIAPDGRAGHLAAAADGTVLIPGLDDHGVHRLVLAGGTADWDRVNLLPCDARQGDLRAAVTASVAADGEEHALVERRRPMLMHLLPIIAAALAALAGWSAFNREDGRAL